MKVDGPDMRSKRTKDLDHISILTNQGRLKSNAAQISIVLSHENNYRLNKRAPERTLDSKT